MASNQNRVHVESECMRSAQYHKLWVVIPFYRGYESIVPLLDSFGNAWKMGLSVVIVDNSPDLERASDLRFWECLAEQYQSLNVLRSSPNLGFGRASNLGAWFASQRGADHVLILNQDAVLSDVALSILWRTVCENPSALVAPVEVIPHTTSIHPQYAEWYLDGLLPADTSYEADELPSFPQLRRTLGGMCVVVPCEVIREIGLFDPLFTMYGEDGDFCRRADQAGILMYLEPRARLEHEHSNLSASGDKRAQIVTWIREGRAISKLRDTESSLVKGVLKIGIRRLLERGYDALILRDINRLRLAFESDFRLARRALSIVRARRGETPLERMTHQVELDWSSTSELGV